MGVKRRGGGGKRYMWCENRTGDETKEGREEMMCRGRGFQGQGADEGEDARGYNGMGVSQGSGREGEVVASSTSLLVQGNRLRSGSPQSAAWEKTCQTVGLLSGSRSASSASRETSSTSSLEAPRCSSIARQSTAVPLPSPV